MLSRLKTKGFLDEARFQEQTTGLNVKINRLHQDLKRVIKFDKEDEILEQIEILTDIFQNREYFMMEFEADIFESIVNKIIVNGRNELEFHLIGGLKFSEII